MAFYLPKKEQTKPKKEKKAKEYSCETCGLSKSPIEPTLGDQYKGLVVVGNKPEKASDGQYRNFTGIYGGKLLSALKQNKINLNTIHVTNAIRCPYHKKSETYAKSCRYKLKASLLEWKPKLIICLGEEAANSVLGLKNKIGITKLRGRVIPSFEFNCLVYVGLNPYELFYNIIDYDGNITLEKSDKINKTLEKTFDWDIKKICTLWNTKYSRRKQVDKVLNSRNVLKDAHIQQIKTVKEFERIIPLIQENGKFSFDYETTNTKPYDSLFDVYYVGIGIRNHAFVIHTKDFDDLSKLKILLYDLLQDDRWLKFIQHHKFEELCSRFWFNKPNQQVILNAFCPMLATHVIDDRRGCTSLDFQNLIRFGMVPYNDKIKKYLEAKDGERTNTIHLCPPEWMIEYNGLDCITSYYQGELLNDKLLEQESKKFRGCYNFLFDSHNSFANATEHGFPVDMEALDELHDELVEEQNEVLKAIITLPDIDKLFKEKPGSNKNKVNRLISTKDKVVGTKKIVIKRRIVK